MTPSRNNQPEYISHSRSSNPEAQSSNASSDLRFLYVLLGTRICGSCIVYRVSCTMFRSKRGSSTILGREKVLLDGNLLFRTE